MKWFTVLLLCLCSLTVSRAYAADTLKVIVIDGEEAANIVAEKLAAVPAIEVRDDKDRPVSGAIVRFVIRKTVRNRLAAVFRNGQPEVRTITDAAGQANSSAITPLEPGSFEIDVEVRYPGQTGKATIRQTNYRTVADAKAAGREPGKSTSSNANAQATPASSAASGAAVPGAAATAAAAGGGMSKLAVAGLVAGGAAGAGAAVVLSRRESAPPAGSVPGVTLSQNVGVQAATPFAFSVQPTGFDAASLSYLWEFGDGATSTDPAPTHVYASPGTYAVVVTVRDARQSVRSETTVTVYTVTGTWTTTDGVTMQLTQSGSTITGSSSWPNGPADLPYSPCAISGSVQVAVPALILLRQELCRHPVYAPLVDMEYRLGMTTDGQVLSGPLIQGPGRPSERTGQIVFRR